LKNNFAKVLLKILQEPLKILQEPLKILQEPLKFLQEPLKILQEPLKILQEPLKILQEDRCRGPPNVIQVSLSRVPDTLISKPGFRDPGNPVPHFGIRKSDSGFRISDFRSRIPGSRI